MDVNDFPERVSGLMQDELLHEDGRLVGVVYRLDRLQFGASRFAPLLGTPFAVVAGEQGTYTVRVDERNVATGAGVSEALRQLRAAFDRECVRVRVQTAAATPALAPEA